MLLVLNGHTEDTEQCLPVLFPAGLGGEVCRGEGEGKEEANSYTGHTPRCYNPSHSIFTDLSISHCSRYLCYMCGLSSSSMTLLEGDQSSTLEDLPRACYSPILLIFRVPRHAHIHVDDPHPHPHRHCSCALCWPCPFHPSATSSLCCYHHVPSRLWNIFAHSSIDFGRSVGER